MEAATPAGLNLIGFGQSNAAFLRNQEDYRSQGPVWSINNAHTSFGFKTDRIIAMDDLKRDEKEHRQYVLDIVTAGVNVITATAYPDWPVTEAFPLAEVMTKFNLDRWLAQRVLTNSCCCAVALAIIEGHRSINLHGFDFVKADDMETVVDTAHALPEHVPSWFVWHQKALVRRPTEPGLDGLMFLLGAAHERNVHFNFCGNTSLLDHDRPGFFYGYQEQPDV